MPTVLEGRPLPPSGRRPLKVLTWHIHGSYLNYLAHCGHDLVVPFLPERPARFAGVPDDAGWPPNITELPAEKIAKTDFDCILYQHRDNWTEDRERWLSSAQLESTPQAFLEHDPPRESPTDTLHVVDDRRVPIVHVTHFNRLMWDSRKSPTVVIEHGVTVPDDVVWTGDLPRGVSVVNNIVSRGRRLGLDVFHQAGSRVPIDLLGMGAVEAGGLGEVPHSAVAREVAEYRFFFNPIRYTSLGLAVCEAMMVGAPIVGLATTEMAVAVESGVNGYAHTDVDRLVKAMQELIDDHGLARTLSEGARRLARERYGIERFARDWDGFLATLAG